MSRVNLSKKQPDAYQRLADLSAAAEAGAKAAGLDPKLVELVKIRVSHLNGCAFCLRMHTRDALALGESSDRLAVLAAWWESQYFTPAEQAALALAEQCTRLSVPEPAIDTNPLTDDQIAAVTWLAVVMNAWNRVAILSAYPVGP